MSKALIGKGFREADFIVRRRLIVSLCAQEKGGKTHFALSSPTPIAFFNADIGMEGVVHKFKGRRILQYDFQVPRTQSEGEEEWNKFHDAFYAALRDRAVRTLVLDTGTEVWELLRINKFGKLTQVMPYQYGPVNAIYRRMIRDVYDTDKNLVILHKMRSVYINDKRTDRYERAGFGDTGYLVQVNAHIRMLPREDSGESAFALTIEDCRQDPELVGEVLQGPLCNFAVLGSMVYPETDPEDWEK